MYETIIPYVNLSVLNVHRIFLNLDILAHNSYIEGERIHRINRHIERLKNDAKEDFKYFLEINSILIVLYSLVCIWGVTGKFEM